MVQRRPHRRGQTRIDDRQRRRIALEAARLISEHGIRDFHFAKRKAALNLRLPDDTGLPRNDEIDAALREHQRLFHADEHHQLLRHLRETALRAMRFLERFQPRLVGAVLDGSADRHSAICLHLFEDTPERVLLFLQEHRIDFTEHNRRLRLDVNSSAEFPALRLQREDAAFDLTVLPRDAIRQAPLDRIDQRPMQRLSLAALEALIESDAAPPQRSAIGT